MEKASRNQTIFSSKPLGVTAWIFLENRFVNPLSHYPGGVVVTALGLSMTA